MKEIRKQTFIENCETGRAKSASRFEKNRSPCYLFLMKKRNPTYAVLNFQYGKIILIRSTGRYALTNVIILVLMPIIFFPGH